MNNIFFKQREGKGTDDDADDDVTGECNKSCLREIDFFSASVYYISLLESCVQTKHSLFLERVAKLERYIPNQHATYFTLQNY